MDGPWDLAFILPYATRPDLDILTNSVSERGAKTAKRHQAVSGYWRSLAPSAAGTAYAAISTRPPPTASPHSTPLAAPSPGNPGYRHSPPSADARSGTP
jgi:hypothetical protein